MSNKNNCHLSGLREVRVVARLLPGTVADYLFNAQDKIL
jgi:hypothetical protein